MSTGMRKKAASGSRASENEPQGTSQGRRRRSGRPPSRAGRPPPPPPPRRAPPTGKGPAGMPGRRRGTPRGTREGEACRPRSHGLFPRARLLPDEGLDPLGLRQDPLPRCLPHDGTLESLVSQGMRQAGEQVKVAPHGGTDQREEGEDRLAVQRV